MLIRLIHLILFLFFSTYNLVAWETNDEADNKVVVETIYGAVRGFRISTKNADKRKSEANVFLGIPFAKPPLDDLRFEKPIDPENWDIRDASIFAPKCFQISRMQMPNISEYSEDCLYLNILAPNWKDEEFISGFPVMVFIHGGGFELGSASDFGYKFMVENYASRGVVLVTIQYRLAQFGFMTLDKDAFRGNYGLWDMIAALKFVQKNIAHFGGDPERVTIFGHSAGGAAVGHLSQSHHADGLFLNAIQLSGSAWSDWACSSRTEANEALTIALGCETSSPAKAKACLKEKTADEILDGVEQIGIYRRNDMNFLLFVPHIDGDFHVDELHKSVHKSFKPATFLGVADAEAYDFTIVGDLKEMSDLYVPPKEYATFDEARFRSFIRKFLAKPEKIKTKEVRDAFTKKIFDFYIHRADSHAPPKTYNNEKNSASKYSNSFFLQQYSKVISDVMFLVPALIDAEAKARAGWTVFLYRFGYLNMDMVEEIHRDIYSVNTHSGEYPYIFNLYFGTKRLSFDENDKKFQENYLNILVDFAKTSNISLPNWSVLDVSKNLRSLPHVEIAPETSVHENIALFTETLQFWKDIRAEYDIHDIHAFTSEKTGKKYSFNKEL